MQFQNGLFMINPIRYQKDHPLTFLLLVNILVCSSLVTLLATVLQLYLDYRTDVSLIEKLVQHVGESSVQGIATSLWNMNSEQINTQMGGLLEFPDIVYVEVQADNEVFAIPKNKPENLETIIISFPLQYQYQPGSKKHEFVGTLTIVASLKEVYKRIEGKVFIILGTQAVKTFIVSVFIIFILRFLVTRHLNIMAQFARSLDLDHLSNSLVLGRKKKKKGKKDELDRVVEAINNMIFNLKKSSEEIKVRARMEGELNAAAVLQRGFSPEKSPVLDGFEVDSTFSAAREMSGDFFDFIRISERYISFVVADVSGKGVSAAMYANIARVLLREKAVNYLYPVDVLKALNKSLKNEFHTNHFLTMCYVLLDLETGKVIYASAGHEPVVLVKANDIKHSLLKPRGYPFGDVYTDIFDDRIKEESYFMQPGDQLFLYTDGLTDIQNEDGEMIGEELLYTLIEENRLSSASQLQDVILSTVRLFQGSADQTDDITMIVIKMV